MQWADALTPDEIEVVRTSLASDKDGLVEAAVNVVAVHELEDLSQELYADVGKSYSFARILSRLTADALTQGEGSAGFEERLQQGTADLLAEKNEDFAQFECLVQAILVTRASKSLRKGEAVSLDIPEAELTEYERLLLEYSSRAQKEAIESIVETLSSAEIAGASEYNLAGVLRTYGRAPIDDMIGVLSAEETLRALSPYARLLFVRHLRWDTFVQELTEEQKAALSKALTWPGYFDAPTSLQISVDLLQQEMKGVAEEN
jgi:hypothetical protein